ncbi:MAG TPA: hypothetical protein VLF18_03550 [Tahibacter sp.]|uniref:hypothetical protein n=1 Tax=Tahibacter sp. TaxID=2056211 RepID=UPI002BFD4864|nr:hypothetical protein [Tahibacter sp.]HSX59256.1 hypothetical protein [Tahibacter sp.]
MKNIIRRCAALLLAALAGAAAAREGDTDPRFSSDGLQTVAFDISTAKTDFAQRVVVDPRKGRYIAVGYVDYGAVGLAAFKPDGSPDTTFGVNGKIARSAPLEDVSAVTLDVINRIVVVGSGRKPGGALLDFDPVVCRYNLDGFPDTDIAPDGCRRIPVDAVANGTDTLSAVTTDGAGQIYVAGQVQLTTSDYDFLVMKLASPDAAPLTTFAGTGRRYIEFDIDAGNPGGDVDGAQAILLAGNSLYIAGYAADEAGNDFAIAKISALNGAIDTAFCPNTTACMGTQRTEGRRTIGYNLGGDNQDRARALAATPDGTILIAGEVQRTVSNAVSTNYLITRVNSNGSFTGGFGSGLNVYNSILPDLLLTGLTVRSDGKILIAGTTASAPLAADPARLQWVVQLSASGQPDNEFTTGLGGGNSSIALILYPKASDSQPTNHEAGALTLDRGRILLAGSRLWAQNLPGGVRDYDYTITRLKGDSIFTDGWEY